MEVKGSHFAWGGEQMPLFSQKKCLTPLGVRTCILDFRA
jgi:hypothetical protein